jgi:hypothetical protein
MKVRTVSLLLCLVGSFLHADSLSFSLLTVEDYELETSLREEVPALSSPINSNAPWESYNEWRCFPTQDIETKCTDIQTDPGVSQKIPTIVAELGEERFEYDLDPSKRWNCDSALEEWAQIISDSDQICIFGAFLQPLEAGTSLWVLDRFKSRRGYWLETDSRANGNGP